MGVAGRQLGTLACGSTWVGGCREAVAAQHCVHGSTRQYTSVQHATFSWGCLRNMRLRKGICCGRWHVWAEPHKHTLHPAATIVAPCRDFRHEKTKKKRGSYRGGNIDSNATFSFKFESDEEK